MKIAVRDSVQIGKSLTCQGAIRTYADGYKVPGAVWAGYYETSDTQLKLCTSVGRGRREYVGKVVGSSPTIAFNMAPSSNGQEIGFSRR